MPNWVTHRLNLAGPPGELARFVERHIQLSPRPVGVLADTVRRWLTQTGATYEVGAATGPTAAERYRFVTTQSDNALEAIIEVDDAKGQIRLSLQQALTLAPGATAGVAALLNTINGSIGLGRFALNARDGSGALEWRAGLAAGRRPVSEDQLAALFQQGCFHSGLYADLVRRVASEAVATLEAISLAQDLGRTSAFVTPTRAPEAVQDADAQPKSLTLDAIGLGFDFDELELSSDIVDQLLADPTEEKLFDLICEESSCESGASSIELFCDGVVVAEYQAEQAALRKGSACDLRKIRGPCVVKLVHSHGNWGTVTIKAPFDKRKIRLWTEAYELGDETIWGMHFRYGEKEFEFHGTRANNQSYYLIDEDGNRLDSEVVDGGGLDDAFVEYLERLRKR
jgi:hypothetical protein